MVKRMAWKEPLGKRFIFNGPNNTEIERKVVGIVKDYNQNSLYDDIEPLMIIMNSYNNYVFVKTEGDVRESIAAIESTWKTIYPDLPFEYEFLDQDFNSQYKSDEKRSQIFTAFSGLTIAIACLGLLGLADFTTQQRYKEIGVRKVIGASINSLVILVSKEFFLLVGIGMLIAFPSSVTRCCLGAPPTEVARLVVADSWRTLTCFAKQSPASAPPSSFCSRSPRYPKSPPRSGRP